MLCLARPGCSTARRRRCQGPGYRDLPAPLHRAVHLQSPRPLVPCPISGRAQPGTPLRPSRSRHAGVLTAPLQCRPYRPGTLQGRISSHPGRGCQLAHANRWLICTIMPIRLHAHPPLRHYSRLHEEEIRVRGLVCLHFPRLAFEPLATSDRLAPPSRLSAATRIRSESSPSVPRRRMSAPPHADGGWGLQVPVPFG